MKLARIKLRVILDISLTLENDLEWIAPLSNPHNSLLPLVALGTVFPPPELHVAAYIEVHT